MPDEDELELVVNRLLIALAEQVAAADPPTLVPDAVSELASCNRSQSKSFYGCAGHLVHYDDPRGMRELIGMVSEVEVQPMEAFMIR